MRGEELAILNDIVSLLNDIKREQKYLEFLTEAEIDEAHLKLEDYKKIKIYLKGCYTDLYILSSVLLFS